MDMSGFTEYVDMVTLSGHKMYGPMGVGALHVRRELHRHMSPVICGAGQQGGLRSGTLPTALCVGLGTAAGFFLGPAADSERDALARQSELFVNRLQSLPWETWLNGPSHSRGRHPGNVNVGFRGISASDLLNRVQPHLAASSGSACTSGIPAPSHVLRSIGLEDRDASSSVRFGLGRYTTDDDVKEATKHIQIVLEQASENDLCTTTTSS